LYSAGICLVLAQIIGIYGLVTRKADLIFALLMAALLIAALVMGGIGAYDRIH
jgi:hypothetical protein